MKKLLFLISLFISSHVFAYTNLDRLTESVKVVCPIFGITSRGGAYSIEFDPAATPAQRTAAQSVVSSFDGSQATLDTWSAAKERSATKVEVDSREFQYRAIRALAEVTRREINLLRAQHSLAPRSQADMKQAIMDMIDAEAN